MPFDGVTKTNHYDAVRDEISSRRDEIGHARPGGPVPSAAAKLESYREGSMKMKSYNQTVSNISNSHFFRLIFRGGGSRRCRAFHHEREIDLCACVPTCPPHLANPITTRHHYHEYQVDTGGEMTNFITKYIRVFSLKNRTICSALVENNG